VAGKWIGYGKLTWAVPCRCSRLINRNRPSSAQYRRLDHVLKIEHLRPGPEREELEIDFVLELTLSSSSSASASDLTYIVATQLSRLDLPHSLPPFLPPSFGTSHSFIPGNRLHSLSRSPSILCCLFVPSKKLFPPPASTCLALGPLREYCISFRHQSRYSLHENHATMLGRTIANASIA